MSSRSFLPNKDAQLLEWASNFSTRITATPTTFGLTAAQATAFAGALETYSTALTASLDPITRTPVTVSAKNEASEQVKVLARLYAKIVEGQGSVTDTQKIELGLNVRKHPSPIPPPSVEPGVDLVNVVRRKVTIHIHDTASSNKRAKPAGALGAKVYTFIGEMYPSDPSLWAYHGDTTKAIYEIAFAADLPAGTQVWVTAAWYNRKGEAGPPSVPISTNLQGGGATAPSMKIAA